MKQCRYRYQNRLQCEDPAETELDKSKPSIAYYDEGGNYSGHMWSSKTCDHGYCYFHYKIKRDRIEQRYDFGK